MQSESLQRMNRSRLTLAAFAAVAGGAASTASAQNFTWTNVRDYPTSLTSATDTWAWSAIRSEPPHFVSYRIAADDFVLDAETTITTITYYSVEIQPPTIIGGDWYIYADDGSAGAGMPGTIIARGDNTPLSRSRIGALHPSFGDIYENVMEPTNLTLSAGTYFLAFRTYQSMPLPITGKPNNAALTERSTNGRHRAHWNFDVLGDGTVIGPWVPMKDFNQVEDQEWAFIIEGEQYYCYPDCDQSTGVGVLDIFDFLCFQNDFIKGDPYGYACSCDTTGGAPAACDIFDFLCFQNAFVAGCP